jgi:soluble lytic murein transglycosylase
MHIHRILTISSLFLFGILPDAFSLSYLPPFAKPQTGENEFLILNRLKFVSKELAKQTELEAQRASIRWKHAQELLGKQYHDSIVKTGEDITSVEGFLNQRIKKGLQGPWKKRADQVSKVVLEESTKHEFDPLFLIAIIQSESSFKPDVIGQFGEIGLMQLTPATAEWIAKKYGLPWKGKESLKNPIINIRIGAAYIAYLRERFAFQSQLYISAYNMGSSNVSKSLEKRILPKKYASRVMNHYVQYYSELKKEIDKMIN